MFDMNYLFDSSKFNGVVLLLDSKLNIVKVNDYFLTLQGYAREEVENNSILGFILPTDKSLYFDFAYSSEITKEFVSQMYHKSGAFRFFSFTVVKYNDYSVLFGSPKKKEFVSYSYDSTAKTCLDEECVLKSVLDVSDMFKDNPTLASFVNFFPSDIWVKDRLGRYVFANNAFEAHTGHTMDEIKGKDDFQVFPKKAAMEFSSSDKIAIKNRKKIDYIFETDVEKEISWTSVSKIPLYNKNNTFIGILGYSVDITEFKNIEHTQKAVINSYRKTINSYLDVAFVFSHRGDVGSIFGKDITKDNLADYKAEICEVFDLSKNEMLKNNLIELRSQNTTMQKLHLFDTLYEFTFFSANDADKDNIYVMGKQVKE